MDDPDIQVCGGSFDALDRHAALVRDALLLEGDGIVEYSIGDQDFVNAGCEGSLVDSPFACTTVRAGHVFTRYPFLPHELVHAVRRLDPELGHLSSVFEEGLATYLGSDTVGGGTVPLEASTLFGDAHIVGGEEYYRAGQTIAILFDEHGADTFRRFDVASTSQDEDQAFVEAFGETKDEFASRAESVSHCEQSQWWIPLVECDGEPLTADPQTGAITLEGDLSCGNADVRGPQFERMWTSRHFRLDQPTGPLDYRFDFPEDATLEIVGCDRGCPERFVYIGGLYDVGAINGGLPRLEPGEYFLRMSRPVAADDGQFEIVLD